MQPLEKNTVALGASIRQNPLDSLIIRYPESGAPAPPKKIVILPFDLTRRI